MKNHIEPKWRDFPIESIKPLLVEDWLKKLDLAPKSKAHLKTLMHICSTRRCAGSDSLSTQPHEPRSREGQFEATKGTKVSDGARILRSLGTHSRTFSNDVHLGYVFGIARKRSSRSQMDRHRLGGNADRNSPGLRLRQARRRKDQHLSEMDAA